MVLLYKCRGNRCYFLCPYNLPLLMFDRLSEDQRQALNIVREGHNLLITGQGGTARKANGQMMYRSPERSPQDSRDGFFLYSAQASFSWPHVDLARLLRRAYSRSVCRCLDYILRVCQSLWDSFLYLGKLHRFLYLLLSYFYDPGMFIFRWSSNFVEKVVLNESMSAKMASRVSYLV